MGEPQSHDEFLARQDEHFAHADVAHFASQTRGAGFAAREARFLHDLVDGTPDPLLEIGCGEGGNLFHVTAPDATPRSLAPTGMDRSLGKLRFAAREIPAARFVCADGGALPFRTASVATVLIRDVLHHLPEPRGTLEEACRVLQPGGRFVLAEPNARNPLIRLQMALVPAERGASRSSETWLRELLAGLPLDGLHFTTAAPFPIYRALLHPIFGLPRLGRIPLTRRLLDVTESAVGRVLGAPRWSYWIGRATRSASGDIAGGMRR
ncbi:MAG: methyltransferase domain-containing protein [Deltaproteobacteria bacterium]|nr:methyltransferase domain-containing protein [Deltaproteobacteria bacterium]